MTLLDRFRTAPRHKHPDPAVRLAFLAEIPLEDRHSIASIAREDDDIRVRRAAVAKLMDPAALGRIAQDDADESVRAQAATMLRDIALEVFEGIGEAEALDAVDALGEAKTLTHVAKSAVREIVALRALARVADVHMLGSVARHAVTEATRRGALELLRERGDDAAEILAVAMNSEYKDTALAAVDLVTDRQALEQIATRGKNKTAAKRARAVIREATVDSSDDTDEPDDQRRARGAPAATAASEGMTATAAPIETAEPAAETGGHIGVPVSREASDSALAQADGSVDVREGESEVSGSVGGQQHLPPPVAEGETRLSDAEEARIRALEEARRRREEEGQDAERARAAVPAQEAQEILKRESERRHARLSELADESAAAATTGNLAEARKRVAVARSEWQALSAGVTVDEALAARVAAAEATLAARETEAREADVRARREALARLQHLLGRVEPLVARRDLSLKAAERALRDVRTALGDMPQLPSKQDYEDATRRLKATHAALTPKLQELRDADDWQRWANAGIQEQLCAKMEALQALEDPEAIAREVRGLQQQWREAADVPRARADALWRRFKAAHDAVWSRCEAHFAAEAQSRAENLAKKMALCEKAESLADSTSWIQTAEEIKRLQAEWKTIGGVPRGREKALWERFRSACDRFFRRRHEDLARRKASWAENFAKKAALCEKAEAIAQSTEWDQAAAELRRLQAEWKTIGPVKKSRSDAIWQRFRSAGDLFFTRYAQRHDVARAERIAAREAICAELDTLAPDHQEAVSTPEAVSNDEKGASASQREAPSDLLAKVRGLRARWQQEIAARGVDPERARALDARFAAAFARVLARWPGAFSGTDLDPDANRGRMESLVRRMEEIARSIAGPAEASGDAALSPTTRLAAMLKEALAANTIGGKVDEDIRLRAAAEDVRQAQASWSRIGPVPEAVRRPLLERFQRACRLITERAGGVIRDSGAGRISGPSASVKAGR